MHIIYFSFLTTSVSDDGKYILLSAGYYEYVDYTVNDNSVIYWFYYHAPYMAFVRNYRSLKSVFMNVDLGNCRISTRLHITNIYYLRFYVNVRT